MKVETTNYMCDIYPKKHATTTGVRITISVGDGEVIEDENGEPAVFRFDRTMDLSDAAMRRLIRFLDRGTTTPAKAEAILT